MATRFYLPNSTFTSYIYVANHANWDVANSSQFTQKDLLSSKVVDSKVIHNLSEDSNVACNVFGIQLISNPLAAQVIDANSTIRGVMRVYQDPGANLSSAMIVRVIDSANEVRTDMLVDIPANLTSEWPDGANYTALTNRYFGANIAIGAEYTINEGDRLVIELGYRSFNSNATELYGHMEAGVGGDGDLAFNESDQTDLDPWIEFSQTLDIPTPISDDALLITGQGGFSLGGDGGSPYGVLPPIKLLTGSGGLKLVGAGVEFHLLPEVFLAQGLGGFQFCGPELSGEYAVTYPTSLTLTGKGGMRFFGGGRWTIPDISSIPSLLMEARGGFRFGGQGIFSVASPAQLLLVGSGGFRFGGWRMDRPRVLYPNLLTLIGSPVIFAMGGEGVWQLPAPRALLVTPSKGVFGFGGAGVFEVRYPPVLLITPTGGFCISGTGLEIPAVDVWVLTGNSFEPSMYTNYGFESFAKKGSQYFGIKADGIYLLSGADDDGEKIVPAVRFGPLNLGNANMKRLREVNVGDDGDGMRVRMEGLGKEAISPVKRGVAWGHRDVQARSFIIDIAGFDKLSHLEITALTVAWD